MAVRLKPVSEQVVVITGASSGIGLATARMFAERGAKGLVLVARNTEELEKVASELTSAITKAVAVPADTGKREDLEHVARVAKEQFGAVDTWVNGAAVAVYGRLWEIPIEDQRRLFEVNYWGFVNGSLIAAREIGPRGGAIINIGSVLSERAMIFQTQYSASKHAVKGFTDGLRMELEREGMPISVTLIKPSAIDTPYPEHARNYLADELALPPPIYDPQLVAKAIVFSAEHEKRELTVGFGGWAIGAMGTVAPRLTDKAMEAVGYVTQTTSQPGRRAMRDNLYRPRQDGDENSSIASYSRKSSLFLEAQLHPVATAMAVAGVGVMLAAAFLTPRRRSAGATPARRYEKVERKRGNGHDKPVQGPGHVSQAAAAKPRPVQPRH